MKYMGSKRAMLGNGLGEAITAEIPKTSRFVDLFTGSGSVAWYVSSQWDVSVTACDLQLYAVSLAEGVLGRTAVVESLKPFDDWISRARSRVLTHSIYAPSDKHHKSLFDSPNAVSLANLARLISADSKAGPITKAYGGYYFSPLQSLWIDALRETLPSSKGDRALALAALICTASRLAAAPGHTAQPFKPNDTAGPFLIRAWKRDVVEVLRLNIVDIGRKAARRLGSVWQGDALKLAASLSEGDLAFIDPPYSAVHYSRFYHVLETVSSGEYFIPEGTGRYPPAEFRPSSIYSLKTQARRGLVELCRTLSEIGARAILTFPEYKTSIGLSGSDVEDIAENYFCITRKSVSTSFSTLGGSRDTRQARKVCGELILTLHPRA